MGSCAARAMPSKARHVWSSAPVSRSATRSTSRIPALKAIMGVKRSAETMGRRRRHRRGEWVREKRAPLPPSSTPRPNEQGRSSRRGTNYGRADLAWLTKGSPRMAASWLRAHYTGHHKTARRGVRGLAGRHWGPSARDLRDKAGSATSCRSLGGYGATKVFRVGPRASADGRRRDGESIDENGTATRSSAATARLRDRAGCRAARCGASEGGHNGLEDGKLVAERPIIRTVGLRWHSDPTWA